MKNRLDRDISALRVSKASNPALVSVAVLPCIKAPTRSFENVCCSDTQNEYSLCGTTVIRLQAKNPFSILRQVSLIFP